MRSAVSASAAAVHSAMVTYQPVFAIIQAATTIVRNSAAVLSIMPPPKRSKPILLHPSVEGCACEAKSLCRSADVPVVRLEGAHDRLSLDGVQSRGFGCQR